MNFNIIFKLKNKFKKKKNSLPLLKKIVVEKLQASLLDFLADFQVASQQRSQNGNKIAIVIVEALSQPTPLSIKLLQLDKQRVVFALEPSIEHNPVHVVVHHQLQSLPQHDSRSRSIGIRADVIDHLADLIFPTVPVLLDHFVGEKRDGHDPPHLPPVLAVDRENHVLTFSGENVEDDVPRPGTELHSLREQHLLGELRRRDHHEVALAHAEQEDVAEFLGEVGEVAVVEVVADLKPVSEDGDGKWAGRELEALAAELGDENGEEGGEEEREKDFLCE